MNKKAAEYDVLVAAKNWAATRTPDRLDRFSLELYNKVNLLQSLTDTDPEMRESVLPSSHPDEKST